MVNQTARADRGMGETESPANADRGLHQEVLARRPIRLRRSQTSRMQPRSAGATRARSLSTSDGVALPIVMRVLGELMFERRDDAEREHQPTA